MAKTKLTKDVIWGKIFFKENAMFLLEQKINKIKDEILQLKIQADTAPEE